MFIYFVRSSSMKRSENGESYGLSIGSIGIIITLYLIWTYSVDILISNFPSLDMWGTIMKTYIEILILLPVAMAFL